MSQNLSLSLSFHPNSSDQLDAVRSSRPRAHHPRLTLSPISAQMQFPRWTVVLGHNAVYITVGFAWLFFADDGAAGDEVTIRQDDDPYGYQLAAMLCFLIFADNLLRRIDRHDDRHEKIMWFGVSAGQWELILVSGVLC